MEWKPIETAPKNGTAVLLYCPEGVDRPYIVQMVCPNICIGSWNAGGKFNIYDECWVSVDVETETYGGSEYTGSWTEDNALPVEPSHWMPLPEPPK